MAFLKKDIKSNLTIFKNRNFPKTFKSKNKKNCAIIGIGCNLGNCLKRFEKVLNKLQKDGLINLVSTSIILKNPPFGYLNQPFFYNSVILVKTNLLPMELLFYLQKVEKYFRRKREFKNSPRTLDLDIILYNNLKVNKPRLKIPHPEYKNRVSVMLPLKYLKGVKCLRVS
jgi:2-amino-4-hydroxy-6-hydroxymethyldihydropteridine diphosphokinase